MVVSLVSVSGPYEEMTHGNSETENHSESEALIAVQDQREEDHREKDVVERADRIARQIHIADQNHR